MKDQDFIAEAKSQSLDVDPVTGAEVETLNQEVYASSLEAVQLAAAFMKEVKE